MRPKDVSRFLRAMLPHDDAPAIFVWGPPGIGKSAIVADTAKALQIGFIDFRLALMDPTDLRGIPIPKEDKAVWLPPSALPSSGAGILFLDELTLAPPLVQSSAYQLVLDKKLGDYSLPLGWKIVAAGNRPEHGANAYKMAFPLRNRFVHIEFETNVDDWMAWAFKNGLAAEIVEFIAFRPDLLFQFDPKRNDTAFASPRSWEFASKLFSQMKKEDGTILLEALEGTVGPASAAEFFAYLAIRETLPSVDEILAGKNFVPEQIDISCALATALAVRAEPRHYARFLEYSAFLPVEAAALLAKMLLSKNRSALLRLSAWKDFASRHRDLLADS